MVSRMLDVEMSRSRSEGRKDTKFVSRILRNDQSVFESSHSKESEALVYSRHIGQQDERSVIEKQTHYCLESRIDTW